MSVEEGQGPPLESALYDTFDPRVIHPRSAEDLQQHESTLSAEPAFDPRYAEDLTGLLFLGALKKQFDWMNHSFVVRTLLQGEYAEIGVVAARYRDTDFAAKAYQCAVVAACLVSVDGKDLPVVPTGSETTGLEEKFRYLLYHWFPFTIDAVYTEFLELEARTAEVLNEMGKASG
jgi:hypothetical protein